MPSLIQAYEYDIFISYRQKDNKYDGWVTEFVSNLKKELEATFKEDISIYFDENPHDGLLETHDVDESLKRKLKCLIFIPIVSQTYCDPKSFAWKHEFLAFKKSASEDDFGLKINLTNGNVASRVLPVRIHDLDAHDRNLIEQELGPLRAIDLVYKSSGINRPLTVKDDEVRTQGKILYRDQINKVANGIKEIVTSLRSGKNQNPQKSLLKNARLNLPSGKLKYGVGALIVILTASILWFTVFKKNGDEKQDLRIAILPFRNNTSLDSLDYYGIGIASEVRTKLSLSKHFSSISALQSTLPYINTDKSTRDIATELGVNYILSGLYQRSGKKLKIEAEFIEASSGNVLWILPVEVQLNDLFELQTTIANKILNQFNRESQTPEIKTTQNLTAYAHYVRGNQLLESAYGNSTDYSASYQSVLDQYKKAIQIDSGFVDAWADLLGVEIFVYASTRDSSQRIEIENHYQYFKKHFRTGWQRELVDAHYTYRIKEEYSNALQLFERVLDVNPENIHATYAISTIYRRQLDLENSFHYAVKYLTLNPAHAGSWIHLSSVLIFMGDYENAYKASFKAWSLSHSKAHAEDLLSDALLTNQLDALPEEIKKSQELNFNYWKALSDEDWPMVKSIARKENEFLKMISACEELGETDSALYYWKRAESVKTEKDSSAYYRLKKDKKKYFSFQEKKRKQADIPKEDIMAKSFSRLDYIDALLKFEDYRAATDSLIQFHRDFPTYGNFGFFLFQAKLNEKNKIFYETVERVKPPLKINIADFIDF